MNDLDLIFYKNFHMDLKYLNWLDYNLTTHYNLYGSKEGRLANEEQFYEKYPFFDLEFYSSFYSDLSIFKDEKYLLMWHYHNYGLKEKRFCTKFNPIFYQNFNLDIKCLDYNEIQLHENYQKYGKEEGRFCCEEDFFKLYPTFNLDFYKDLHSDLNIFNGDKYLLMNHYHNYGFKEDRVCFQYDFSNLESSTIQYELINNSNQTNKEGIFIIPKEEYRIICLQNMNYIRYLDLPNFQENSNNEAVLIEYRCFPHLEFLIRNTINKLGENWSHTIICGNLNYDYMINLCLNISNKIKVIKTNYDNLFPSDYSRFLSSLDFWNLFNGEKILIYQEDTCIFKNNIDDFLHWDYIGAPWPENQNDNSHGVGNGGLSLRSKSIMKKIIESIGIMETNYNQSTLDYIKNTNSNVPPEDVYFTKNMTDKNIGLLADRVSAFNFSTETLVNKDSLGGHQFWLNDPDWRNRIYENIIIQLKPELGLIIKQPKISFKPNFETSFLEHRGGWKSILDKLIKNNFYDENSKFDFFDIIENSFLWNTEKVKCENNWAGIIHCTFITPEYLDIININNLFKYNTFMESLRSCKFILTLSNYISNFLKIKFKELKLNIPILTLKHPVEINNIPLFNFDDFKINKNKKLIQIGQQLRKITSIYKVNSLYYEKMWLTGTKNLNHSNVILDREINFFNLDKEKLDKNVQMYYTSSFEEYDDLLSKNIVFIDLFDAAANNTVLECIVRNTPILVNKIEPVIEYLGEDYPLYFNNLDDIPLLLNDQNKILKAHEYLCNMKKDDLSIDYFINNLIYFCDKYFG